MKVKDNEILGATRGIKTEGKALSANRLLTRKPDDKYIEEWTDILAREKDEIQVSDEKSVIVFRLYNEWLALSTILFTEVAEKKVVHRIPHRSGSIILGLVNLRGLLRPAVSIHNLLQIEPLLEADKQKASQVYYGMLAIEKDGEQWIFPVDEIYGIHQCNLSQLENVPVTVSKSTANYLKGVINFDDKRIGYLDDELLFYSLKRSIV